MRDLAELYGVETRALLQGCKPESKTIPGRFYVPDVKRGIRTFEITNCDLKRKVAYGRKGKSLVDPRETF